MGMTTTPFHTTTIFLNFYNFYFVLYVVKQADAEQGIKVKAVSMCITPLTSREWFWIYIIATKHQIVPLIC